MKEIEATGAKEELDVAEGEGSSIRTGVGVFARAKEEEESNDDHVGNCSQVVRVGREDLCNLTQATDDRNWDGLDPIWRRVDLLPSLEHPIYPKVNGLGRVQTRVVLPHGEERLGNAP